MSDPGDIAYSYSPRAMIVRLVPMIKNNSSIANYVNGYWGTKITASDVERVRKTVPTNEMRQIEPAVSTGKDEGPAIAKASAALLSALRKHHPSASQ